MLVITFPVRWFSWSAQASQLGSTLATKSLEAEACLRDANAPRLQLAAMPQQRGTAVRAIAAAAGGDDSSPSGAEPWTGGNGFQDGEGLQDHPRLKLKLMLGALTQKVSKMMWKENKKTP